MPACELGNNLVGPDAGGMIMEMADDHHSSAFVRATKLSNYPQITPITQFADGVGEAVVICSVQSAVRYDNAAVGTEPLNQF